MFTSSGVNFMAPLAEIVATVPQVEVTPGSVAGGICAGMLRRHGLEMAVVDTRAAFGFGPPGPPVAASAGIAVEFGSTGTLAFMVDAVTDIRRVDPAGIVPVPPKVSRRSDLLDGVFLDPQGRQHFVVDPAAFRKDPGLCRLAELAHRVSASSEAGGDSIYGGTGQGRSVFVIVHGGARVAIPIDQVVEVLRVPPQLRGPVSSGHLANLTHRGSLMPVFDLADRLGYPATERTPDAAILVVRREDYLYGWIVARLISIEVGTLWRDDPGDVVEGEPRTGTCVQFGGPEGEMVGVVDLRACLA
nr:chemotaxis protein CheW [Mesobacterium pallidum]